VWLVLVVDRSQFRINLFIRYFSESISRLFIIKNLK